MHNFRIILPLLVCILFMTAGCGRKSNTRERDYTLQPPWNASIPSATVRIPAGWTFEEKPDAPVSSSGKIYELASAKYDPDINTVIEHADSNGNPKPGLIAWVQFYYMPNIEGKSLKDCGRFTTRRQTWNAKPLGPVDEDLSSPTDSMDRLIHSFEFKSDDGEEWVARCCYVKLKSSNVVYGVVYMGPKDECLVRQGDIDLIFKSLRMQESNK